MTNPVTKDRRHFEDLRLGEVIVLGSITVTRDMIIDFARQFDPLPFHLDEKAAKASLLGGLASSGWQTGALSLRLLNDAFLGKIASAGTVGMTDLKWKAPVMVGDTIGGTATIVELSPAAQDEPWGIAAVDFDMGKQQGRQVMTMRLACRVELAGTTT